MVICYHVHMVIKDFDKPFATQNDLLTVIEAAEILGISTDTIRRWEKKGLIKADRSKNNHRLFDLDELFRVRSKYQISDEDSRYQIFKDPPVEFSAIELFSGAGGLALGLENAGINTKLLVEIDKDCVETMKKNRPRWNILHSDIKGVPFSDYRGKVDIVAGGFPCQAFSYAGYSRGFEDTRGTLFFEFARCIEEVQPQIALAENVRGLLRHDQGRTLSTMLQTLSELGYYVDFHLIRSQFLDVPQKRERLVIVGIKKGLLGNKYPRFAFPKEKNYFITLREALKDCPKSSGSLYPERKRRILEMVPPGGYWRDLPTEIQKEYMKGSFLLGGGKTGMARRLSFDEPSLTLTCNPAQKQTERCHPIETRPLNIREYARIQTFPDDWEFVGSTVSQYKQIGNAVPVNLGYHIGKCLIAMLKQEFDTSSMLIKELDKTKLQKALYF